MYIMPPCSPPQGSTSPFVYADGVFSDDQLDWILKYAEKLELHNAETVEYSEDYRKSYVSPINNGDETAWLFETVADVTHKLNSNYYRFDLSMIGSIQYVVYHGHEGGKYDWHHDYNEGLSPSRKLTVVLQLSDPSEYEGGQLELFSDPLIQIPKKKGMMCMFPAFSYHRVTPVLSGTRKVLVFWIWGPPFS